MYVGGAVEEQTAGERAQPQRMRLHLQAHLDHGVVSGAVEQEPMREQAQQVRAVHRLLHKLAHRQVLLGLLRPPLPLCSAQPLLAFLCRIATACHGTSSTQTCASLRADSLGPRVSAVTSLDRYNLTDSQQRLWAPVRILAC